MTAETAIAWAGGLSIVLIVAFLLGAAPGVIVRLTALLYPEGHQRRPELLAEMDYVRRRQNVLQLWGWLGEQFSTAVCDAIPERRKQRRGAQHRLEFGALTESERASTVTNSRGIAFYLHTTEVTLRGGEPQRIYFFAKVPRNAKGQPVALPPDREVKENPRNGFLTISKKKATSTYSRPGRHRAA